jgi:subtilisin family serine protease
MQKRTFLFLAVLCFLVVSVSVAYALSLDDYFGKNKITGLAGSTNSYKAGIKTGTCTDSDGGKEPDQNYVKGTVNRKYFVGFKGWKKQSSTDYCKNSSHLVEYTCVKDARISSQIVNCPYGCENSSCSKTSEVSVSIATLKDAYNTGEKIELTDPPENMPVADSQRIAGFNTINTKGITSTSYSSLDNAKGIATTKLSAEESNGYIVQFSEAPLTVKERQLKDKKVEKTAIKDELKAQRARIKEEHARLKSEIAGKIKTSRATGMAVAGEKTKSSIIGRIILKLTGKAVSGNGDLSLLGEYENVFNGIALNVSADEANEIRKISGVKEVFPNLKVNITLMDSVPLINADDVWQMQDANNQTITGKGMKIAIIDTGVDYTHPDLGGEYYKNLERSGIKINENPLYFDWPNHDQKFVLNNNRIAYFSESSLYVYDFNSKETAKISISDSFKIARIGFEGNFLAYTAVEKTALEPYVYLYNLDTKEHQKIYDLSGYVGYIYVSNSKVIFQTKETEIKIYNILTGQMDSLSEDDGIIAPPAVSNGIISYPVAHIGGYCYDKAVIYDTSSGEKKEIIPPDIGPIFDVNGDRILYASCSKTAFDFEWKSYYLYDFKTGNYEILKYPDSSVSPPPVTPAPEPGNNLATSFGGFMWISSWIEKGRIENGIIYFSKDINADKIIAYDENLKRYVLINLFTNSLSIDSDEKRVCFLNRDIICHEYNSSYDYPIPNSFFSDRVTDGWDFVNNDADPMDDHGHGTHCAGIAAGNGVLKGVAPDAKIYAYKVLSSGGWGYYSWIIGGIERAVDPNKDSDFSDHVDVISMSLGGQGDPDDPMSQAVDNAVTAGVTAVIAAGNSGSAEETIASPGTARKAITIGATDKNDAIAVFSSRGPVIWTYKDENEKIIEKMMIKPDIVAPGVNICASQYSFAWNDRKCFDDKHVAISGTSMATPHVAGAVALIKQAHPDWTPDEIKIALRNTAVDLGEPVTTQGYGRINVSAAVSLLHKPCIAEISTSGEVLGLVDIYGTASCDEFAGYDLYYKLMQSKSWIKLYSSDSSVINGRLALFDTTTINNGEYLLKLVVKNNYGEESNEMSFIEINNFEITSIGNAMGYIKGIEQVKGRIRISNFSAYKIEYRKEGELIWNKSYYSAQKPIDDEGLCQIDVSKFENGVYYFKLSVLKNDKWTEGQEFRTAVVKEMLDGWPIQLNISPKGEYAIEDVDKDGFKELILPQYAGKYALCPLFNLMTWQASLYIFEKNGGSMQIETAVKGTDEYLLQDETIPSIIYNKENSENLLALTNEYNCYGGGGGIIDNSGNFKFNWPYYPNWSLDPNPSDFVSPFVVQNDKLFVIFRDWLGKNPVGILGFDKYGSILPNFPIQVKKESLDRTFVFRGIGLSNNNIEPKIAIAAGEYTGSTVLFYLDIYSYNGSLIKRTYLFNNLSRSISLGYATPLIIADLNNDDEKEIVVGYVTVDFPYIIFKTYIAVIDFNGSIVFQKEIEKNAIEHLAIGNFGRGKPEIIALLSYYDGNRLITLDYSGNLILDKQFTDSQNITRGLVIGDVNSDDEQEIIISYRPAWWKGESSGFKILDKNGNLLKNLEIPTFGEVDYWQGLPILSDFNNDGKVDITQQSEFIPVNSVKGNTITKDYTRIYALDLGGIYNEDKMDWPMFMHDSQRTGCYDCERLQSKIVNKGGADVIGNLTITISRKTDKGWDDNYKIVFFRKGITVPANGLVKLDALFNPLDIRVNEPGNYSVYMEFKDKSARFPFKVEGQSSNIIKVTH